MTSSGAFTHVTLMVSWAHNGLGLLDSWHLIDGEIGSLPPSYDEVVRDYFLVVTPSTSVSFRHGCEPWRCARCGAGHWFGMYIWYTKPECFMSYCGYEYMILILVLLENRDGRKGCAWWRTLIADGNKMLTPTTLLYNYLSFGLDKSFGIKFLSTMNDAWLRLAAQASL